MTLAAARAQSPAPRTDDHRDPAPTLPAIRLHWEQVPLSEAVERLAHALRQPIFVDRRVDPTRLVNFSSDAAAAEVVLNTLASELGLGVSHIKPVFYLGPPDMAQSLRTLAALRGEEARQLPPDERQVLGERKPRSWPRLAEPRSLVTELMQGHGWSVDHAELIPYDRWPAGQLPAMSLSDQLTLLLAGFDLTFHPLPGQHTLVIQPIERPVTLRKGYRLSAAHMPDLESLRRQLPGADLQLQGRQLILDGRLEDHERLPELLGRRPVPPQRKAPPQKSEKRYSLRVDHQSAASVLRQLCKQLAWNLHLDSTAQQSLDQPVSFSVADATIDELLEALLKPAGLTYRLEGQELTVVPRPGNE
jgi:hypothetical protein